MYNCNFPLYIMSRNISQRLMDIEIILQDKKLLTILFIINIIKQ